MEKKTVYKKNEQKFDQLLAIKSGSQALFHNQKQAKDLVLGKFRFRTQNDLLKLFNSTIISPN